MMIGTYLRERLSWILLFFATQFLILFIVFIDSSIPVGSVLYIHLLSFLLFAIFLTVRYHKETKFYRSLADREYNLDITGIIQAESPFEKLVEETITEQTALLKREAAQNFILLEQEKDDLLAWIHEVKTPLTALKLMIDRLDDETMKKQMTYEWLRVHLLLDQQLHKKRLPFMQNDLYIEKTELEPIVFEEIQTLRAWCMQKGLGFHIDLHEEEVYTDAKWLGFILRQILSNAIKYSEQGDIIVRSERKGDQHILQVQDFGKGISAKDLPRIFDKGFTSTEQHQNSAATGMGLYLAKKAADSLLIHIDVTSARGSGTTLTLTFPKKNDFVDMKALH